MKRIFTTITLLATIIFAGCTDLDDVYRQLDEQDKNLTRLEAQMKSLEQLMNNANSEIASIQGLVDAMNKKVSVVSYRELDDKSGYELTMSDGSKITLKHGAKGEKGDPGQKGDPGKKGEDGLTPVINVKRHTDGLLYWTINGNWLLDADGNKVSAEGKNGEDGEQGAPGADGITPQLRINADFFWEVSFDEGETWQPVKDADGNPIPTQGPKGDAGNDGDANLTITEVGDVIIITYKDVTYNLPKAPVKMVLTTAKSPGETIELTINAAWVDRPGVWIDLNNNGEKDDGEAVTNFSIYSSVKYPLGARTVTVYGKVTLLDCDENQLTSLNVSNNTALEQLYCGYNQLTSLNVSNNEKLEVLLCNNNQLTSLNVSNNPALTTLYCYENQLTSLNVSKNTALLELECSNNQLISLDVSNNKELEILWCNNNQLATLNVSNKIALTRLDCYENQLTTLNLSNNPALTELYCFENQLATLNLSSNPALTELYCWSNQLISLNLSNNPALTELYCYKNQLTTLDVSENPALTRLSCGNNQLISLNVSNNKELWLLYCYNNKISGDNMTALVNSLPDRNDKEEGKFKVIAKESDIEHNVITATQAAEATSRNWKVQDSEGNPYTPGS